MPSLTHTDSTARTPEDLPADAQWLPAVIPGGVHESLLAAGLVPDPFVDQNEDEVRWVEDRTWWYRIPLACADMPGPEDTVSLVLPSLDTVATVWFNGTLLRAHANAFRPFVADVTALVRDDNEVVVRLAPPLEGLEQPVEPQTTLDVLTGFITAQTGGEVQGDAVGLLLGDTRLTRRRKPTYSWGWDFAPRIPSVGVLAAPKLVTRGPAALTGSHVRTVALAGRTAQVAVDVEAVGPAGLTAEVTLTSPSGAVISCVMQLGQAGSTLRGSAVVEIPDAELWWTHDLGAPALYDVAVQLHRGETTLDTDTFRVGLRTVALDRPADPEEGGRLFRFLLNGVPVFARGANWVPASMLRGSVTADRVTELVTLARDGGQNMLRVWGGGAYEQDAFYDACDALGLLVWQDFMFACFDYPSADSELQQEVALEAAYQVRRLRNHASLALWCGNNEVETLHLALRQSLEPGDWGWHLFHAVLPDVVASESPGAVYWPGSPWADSDPEGVNGPLDGDRHFWDVWHGSTDDPDKPAAEGFHWHRYLEDLGKFSSEFGIQSAAHLDTLERWLTEPIDINSETFLRRTKEGRQRKSLRLAKYEIGLVSSPEEYVDYSQACQAEGLKFGIEHYRRRQPHCSGTLVWQLNDCWPGMSWSLIDFDLKPKAAYYFLQRVFQPVIASFSRTPDGVELWVSNSSPHDARLDLVLEIGALAGPTSRQSLAYTSKAQSSEVVWRSAVSTDDEAAFVSELSGAVPANRCFLGRLKDLPLTVGRVQAEVVKQGPGTATVRLTASGYCYFSRLATDRPGIRFSSNYVDLRDGEHVDIEVTGLPEGGVEALQAVSWGQPPQPVG